MNPFIKAPELQENIKKVVQFEQAESIEVVWDNYYKELENTEQLIQRGKKPDGEVERVEGIRNPKTIFGIEKLQFITDRRDGRQKAFLMEPYYKDQLLADHFMIVTATGSKPDRPAGHLHAEGSRRWEIPQASKLIDEKSHMLLNGEISPISDKEETLGEPGKEQTFRRRNVAVTEGASGLLIVNEILEGSGAGRVWSVYYPYDIGFDLMTSTSHHSFSVLLGFGQTIVQGSKESNSPVGATHITVGGIRPNFIEYF